MLKREGIRVAHVPNIRSASQYNSTQAAASRGARQSTNEVLMVAPTAFGFNEQAAQDNSFMHGNHKNKDDEVARVVLDEFSGLYHELTEVRELMQWQIWSFVTHFNLASFKIKLVLLKTLTTTWWLIRQSKRYAWLFMMFHLAIREGRRICKVAIYLWADALMCSAPNSTIVTDL